jgi:predicted metal-binding membrane protein
VRTAPAAAERSGLRVKVDPLWLTALVLAGASVTWVVAIDRMRGMDDGPGTDLGGLGWFLGVWVTMMAAMMLPSVAPVVLTFARVTEHRARTRGAAVVPTWVFAAAYLAVWAAYGLVAYGVFRLVDAAGPALLAWDSAGPYVAGGAVAAAGLYGLTPLKDVCLRHCRSPLHFILRGWRGGWGGALRMGTAHGLYCVGCCAGLFVILFALGVMSLFWMAVVSAVIFAEKLVPHGRRLSRLFSIAFVALGIWIAVAPGSVPGLTTPDSAPGMHMDSSRGMTHSGGTGR